MKPVKSKKRAKKDPNAPKKALSAYMLWLNDTRDEIKKDNPGISITELSKKAGVLWKALEDKSVCSEAIFAVQRRERELYNTLDKLDSFLVLFRNGTNLLLKRK